MLFPTYHLENERTEQVILLDAVNYTLAGLLASFYVFWRTDFGTFARAFLVNLAFLLAAGLAVMAASPLPGHYALIAIVVASTILALVQSRVMIRYVLRFHARAGWTVSRS